MAIERLRSTATDTVLERVLEAARNAAGSVIAGTSRWTDTVGVTGAGSKLSGPLSDPDLVPATVATELGLDLADDVVSPQRVANSLGRKQLMLVLDNCEHVVDAAAQTAEALLRGNPATRVIATSREPLRVEGEGFPGTAARRAE
jgi:hypothetical protein